MKEELRHRLDNPHRSLPETTSFLSVESERVIPTWVKQAEDGRGLILRLFEAGGERSPVTIHPFLKIKKTCETDLIEYDQQVLDNTPNLLHKDVAAHKIETLRFQFEEEDPS
jgi:alpha-mannosidase